jgi:hypothetical protein
MANQILKSVKFLKIPVLFGILIGLLAGGVLGMLAGGMLSGDHLIVQATATHGQSNYAMATGELNADVELVAFLDPETGYLKVAVINVRNYKFQIFYVRNISKDFETVAGKNPRYLMTTGRAVFNFQSGKRFARSVIYVTELNSGKCIAYGMQSYPNSRSLKQKIYGKLILLDEIDFSEVPIPVVETTSPEDKQETP